VEFLTHLGFGVGAYYWFRAGEAVANPGAVVENSLRPSVRTTLVTLRPPSSVGSTFNFSVNLALASGVKWKFSRTG
jgi:hypothetical protein